MDRETWRCKRVGLAGAGLARILLLGGVSLNDPPPTKEDTMNARTLLAALFALSTIACTEVPFDAELSDAWDRADQGSGTHDERSRSADATDAEDCWEDYEDWADWCEDAEDYLAECDDYYEDVRGYCADVHHDLETCEDYYGRGSSDCDSYADQLDDCQDQLDDAMDQHDDAMGQMRYACGNAQATAEVCEAL
jgi:hypothetical protein